MLGADGSVYVYGENTSIVPIPHQNPWTLTMHRDRPFPAPRLVRLQHTRIRSDASKARAAGSNTQYQVNSFVDAQITIYAHFSSPSFSFELSCDHTLAMTLDANSTVWIFVRWDRPLRLVSPFLDCSSPKTTPVQVECSSPMCAVLTKSGDMYAWRPFTRTFKDRYKEGLAEPEKGEYTKATIPDDGAVISFRTMEIDWDPVKAPMLPDLPELPETGLSEEERRKETKLIKIAATHNCFIGLTNKGHVLRLDGLSHGDSGGTWDYVRKSAWKISYLYLKGDTQLPNFSEIDKIKECSAFHTTIGDDGEERPPKVELSSDTMLITDVSRIPLISSGSPYLRSLNV